jgi:hypothetical protein
MQATELPPEPLPTKLSEFRIRKPEEPQLSPKKLLEFQIRSRREWQKQQWVL